MLDYLSAKEMETSQKQLRCVLQRFNTRKMLITLQI